MLYQVAKLSIECGANVAPALAGLQTLSRAVSGVGGFIGNIASTALGVLGGEALFAAARAGVDAFAGGVIGMNATLETSQLAFTTLLHSSDAARQMLTELVTFAQQTPFDLSGVLQGSKQLLAVGFSAQSVIPWLTTLGNVSSALSLGQAGIPDLTRIIGQFHTSGRVLQRELNELQLRGVNTGAVFEVMAGQTGKTVAQLKEMQKAGKLPADLFLRAFQTWADTNFPNLMAQQAKTFVGLWENVGDTLRAAGARIGGPLFQMLKDL